MYFESRINNIATVATIEEAAERIKNTTDGFDGYRVMVNNIEYIFVNDNMVDGVDRIKEVAVVDQTNGHVIESITADWISSPKKLAQRFAEALADNKLQYNAKVPTCIEECKMAWFTCSCCGEQFRSNYQYQKQFDKDTGYGLCNDCERIN
jgi:hypothetical protein